MDGNKIVYRYDFPKKTVILQPLIEQSADKVENVNTLDADLSVHVLEPTVKHAPSISHDGVVLTLAKQLQTVLKKNAVWYRVGPGGNWRTWLPLYKPSVSIDLEVTPLTTVVKKNGKVRKLFNRGSSFPTYIREGTTLIGVGDKVGVTGKPLLRRPFDGPEEAINIQEGVLWVEGVSHASKSKASVKLFERVRLTSPQTTPIVLDLQLLAAGKAKQLRPTPNGMKISIEAGTGLDLTHIFLEGFTLFSLTHHV
jgi:hypothetical protein